MTIAQFTALGYYQDFFQVIACSFWPSKLKKDLIECLTYNLLSVELQSFRTSSLLYFLLFVFILNVEH
jgi:hypothetical protein